MTRSAALSLLLAISVLLAACGWEERKQTVVQTISAVVLEHFVSVQRCATLTQGAVKSPGTSRPVPVRISQSARSAEPADHPGRTRVCRESKRPKLDGRFAEADVVRSHKRSTCTG